MYTRWVTNLIISGVMTTIQRARHRYWLAPSVEMSGRRVTKDSRSFISAVVNCMFVILRDSLRYKVR